jgi:hypothetical protein
MSYNLCFRVCHCQNDEETKEQIKELQESNEI